MVEYIRGYKNGRRTVQIANGEIVEFDLSWDNGMTHAIEEFKLENQNHDLYISLDQLKYKIREKKLFDNKRDVWYELQFYEAFQLTSNYPLSWIASLNDFSEYVASDYDFDCGPGAQMLYQRNKAIKTMRFGMGDSEEGFFVGYLTMYIVEKPCIITKIGLQEFFDPSFNTAKFEFFNPVIVNAFQSFVEWCKNYYLNVENDAISSHHMTTLEIDKLFLDISKHFSIDTQGHTKIFDFANLLKDLTVKNQSEILVKQRELNVEVLENIVSIIAYLNKKDNMIYEIMLNLNTSTSLQVARNQESMVLLSLKSSYLICLHGINIVVSLIDNDVFNIYSITKKLDEMRIFESSWQIETFNALTRLINSTQEINDNLINLERQIVDQLESIAYEISSSMTKYGNSIIDELDSLNSKAATANLLSIIGMYKKR
jgi:hypothetical protein